jgi:TonB-dependent receptor
MKKIFLIILIGVVMQQAQAQGFLRGKITDGETGETLIGATILVSGTTTGTSADIDGNYSLKLQPGVYAVVFQFVSYQSKTVSDVQIKNGETTTIDISLASATTQLQEVVVTAEQARDTENSLLVIQKKSANLVDGISDQTFRKLGDNDLGVAMKRVTGVSVQGGKYVYVRGLGDRYTKTTLNGMNIPGLDPDNNSVQIDIFPTNTIENVMVYKTFSPNLPGDFTGGLVDVESKSFPDEKTTRFSFGLGFNPDMNLRSDFVTYNGSKTDYLGFDDGTRKLPFGEHDIIPEITSSDRAQTEQYTRTFDSQLGAKKQNSFLNHNFAFNHGNQVNLNNKTFGYNAVLTYRKTFEFYEDAEFGEYFKDADIATGDLVASEIRKGQIGTENVEWSALATTALKFDKHSFALSVLRSQNGNSSASNRTSANQFDNPSVLQDDILTYTQRSVTNAVLTGKHKLSAFDVEWKGAWNASRIYEPDFRSTRIQDLGDGNYDLQVGVGAGIDRFYRDLNEDNLNAKVDVSYAFSEKNKLRFGVNGTKKERRFEVLEYYFRIRGSNTVSGDPNDLLRPENIWTEEKGKGIYVKGNYDPSKNFDASQNIYAGYLMNEIAVLPKLKAIYGMRVEKASMRYSGANQLREVLNDTLTLDDLDLLPSVNVVYAVDDQMNIRISANRTLARPNFKEKSNAQIFDPISKRMFIGNLDLQETHINNFDLRWESFFGTGEMVSASAFYKDFHGHIEMVSFETAPDNIKPRNSGNSEVYGVEVEFRKTINRFFSFGSNASYVESRVDLKSVIVNEQGKTEYELRQQYLRSDESGKTFRPMAGQSPFLVNAFVGFEDKSKTLQANLAYNVQGETLAIVGSGRVPDIYTRPFNSLNLNLSKTLGAKGKSKVAFGATNILDAARTNYYKSHGAEEKIFSSFSPGRTYSLSYSYTF